jgi:membrane associated rhomboid family serine protease
MKHKVSEEIQGVLTFFAVMWGVYLLDCIIPIQFVDWGIVPRTLYGLIGIPLAPILHAGLGHILSNTIPIFILLTLLAGSRTRTWETVIEIILLGGLLLWIFGRPAVHVGASSLVYGLIAFLIVSGFRERRPVPLVVAILVGVLYGTTLISGVIPKIGSNVSWDGHLCGAIAGGILGYFTLSRESKDDSTLTQPPEIS